MMNTDLIKRLRSRAWDDRQHWKLRDEAADALQASESAAVPYDTRQYSNLTNQASGFAPVAYHYKYSTDLHKDVWGVGYNVPKNATEHYPLGRIAPQPPVSAAVPAGHFVVEEWDAFGNAVSWVQVLKGHGTPLYIQPPVSAKPLPKASHPDAPQSISDPVIDAYDVFCGGAAAPMWTPELFEKLDRLAAELDAPPMSAKPLTDDEIRAVYKKLWPSGPSITIDDYEFARAVIASRSSK